MAARRHRTFVVHHAWHLLSPFLGTLVELRRWLCLVVFLLSINADAWIPHPTPLKHRMLRLVPFWATKSATAAAAAMRRRVRCQASVTGTIYECSATLLPDNNTTNINSTLIVITLFTKEACTLCDTVKQTLSDIRFDYPHTLRAVDITDDEQRYYYDRYKYDIPVLHINNVYWTKHRLSRTMAEQTMQQVADGSWSPPSAHMEPNAAAQEHSRE